MADFRIKVVLHCRGVALATLLGNLEVLFEDKTVISCRPLFLFAYVSLFFFVVEFHQGWMHCNHGSEE